MEGEEPGMQCGRRMGRKKKRRRRKRKRKRKKKKKTNGAQSPFHFLYPGCFLFPDRTEENGEPVLVWVVSHVVVYAAC